MTEGYNHLKDYAMSEERIANKSIFRRLSDRSLVIDKSDELYWWLWNYKQQHFHVEALISGINKNLSRFFYSNSDKEYSPWVTLAIVPKYMMFDWMDMLLEVFIHFPEYCEKNDLIKGRIEERKENKK